MLPAMDLRPSYYLHAAAAAFGEAARSGSKTCVNCNRSEPGVSVIF